MQSSVGWRSSRNWTPCTRTESRVWAIKELIEQAANHQKHITGRTMDKKFDNGSFVALSLIISAFLASSLSGRVLDWLELEPTMSKEIIAGTLVGLPIFIAI